MMELSDNQVYKDQTATVETLNNECQGSNKFMLSIDEYICYIALYKNKQASLDYTMHHQNPFMLIIATFKQRQKLRLWNRFNRLTDMQNDVSIDMFIVKAIPRINQNINFHNRRFSVTLGSAIVGLNCILHDGG